MSSKSSRHQQIKTLLQSVLEQTHQHFNPQSTNNHPFYYQQLTIILLKAIKYINQYLQLIITDQYIGSIINGIIQQLNQSYQQYKSQNIFVDGITSFNQSDQKKQEDQIYHFMNTRNNLLPLECLSTYENDKQRRELLEFVSQMESKKAILYKQSKHSLIVPRSNIKIQRKTTFDPKITQQQEKRLKFERKSSDNVYDDQKEISNMAVESKQCFSIKQSHIQSQQNESEYIKTQMQNQIQNVNGEVNKADQNNNVDDVSQIMNQNTQQMSISNNKVNPAKQTKSKKNKVKNNKPQLKKPKSNKTILKNTKSLNQKTPKNDDKQPRFQSQECSLNYIKTYKTINDKPPQSLSNNNKKIKLCSYVLQLSIDNLLLYNHKIGINIINTRHENIYNEYLVNHGNQIINQVPEQSFLQSGKNNYNISASSSKLHQNHPPDQHQNQHQHQHQSSIANIDKFLSPQQVKPKKKADIRTSKMIKENTISQDNYKKDKGMNFQLASNQQQRYLTSQNKMLDVNNSQKRINNVIQQIQTKEIENIKDQVQRQHQQQICYNSLLEMKQDMQIINDYYPLPLLENKQITPQFPFKKIQKKKVSQINFKNLKQLQPTKTPRSNFNSNTQKTSSNFSTNQLSKQKMNTKDLIAVSQISSLNNSRSILNKNINISQNSYNERLIKQDTPLVKFSNKIIKEQKKQNTLNNNQNSKLIDFSNKLNNKIDKEGDHCRKGLKFVNLRSHYVSSTQTPAQESKRQVEIGKIQKWQGSNGHKGNMKMNPRMHRSVQELVYHPKDMDGHNQKLLPFGNFKSLKTNQGQFNQGNKENLIEDKNKFQQIKDKIQKVQSPSKKACVQTNKLTMTSSSSNFKQLTKKSSMSDQCNSNASFEMSSQLRTRNRRQKMKDYLQLIQIAHKKFCGNNCTHITNIFKTDASGQYKIPNQLLRIMMMQK